VRRYTGPGNYDDWANAIAVDGSGNVYVTGFIDDSATFLDYATIKYDPNGNELWVRRYTEPGIWVDRAYAIALDNSGNVYVTGASRDDYATIKYSPQGNELWVRRYNGSGDGPDRAYAIAVDGSNNVYVTGESWGSGTGVDYVTIKYSPQGTQLWVQRYSGPHDYDVAYAIALDGSGNVYVTGESYGSGGTPTDYATIKYAPQGTQLWVQRYNGPVNQADVANAIAIDGSNNVYVTGRSDGGGTDYDYATLKYDSQGTQLWVQRYNGPVNGADWACAIAVDGSGNVYVTGESWGSGTDYDYATIKYSSVSFLRGDCDKDGSISLVDVILLANYVLKGGPAPNPLQSGDVNCDGKYDLVDVILLARYVLLGEPFPC
jgi:hypothetical protein